jgi:hypothetical protein
MKRNSADLKSGIFRNLPICMSIFVTLAGGPMSGCNSREAVPKTGRVQISLSTSSDQNLLFNLENGSSDSISFRGWSAGGQHGASTSVLFSLTCYSKQRPESTVDFPPFPHDREEHSVVVPSGARTQLLVPISNQEIKDTTCQFSLQLQNGTAIRSATFELSRGMAWLGSKDRTLLRLGVKSDADNPDAASFRKAGGRLCRHG